jgi:hypothetical protein
VKQEQERFSLGKQRTQRFKQRGVEDTLNKIVFDDEILNVDLDARYVK